MSPVEKDRAAAYAILLEEARKSVEGEKEKNRAALNALDGVSKREAAVNSRLMTARAGFRGQREAVTLAPLSQQERDERLRAIKDEEAKEFTLINEEAAALRVEREQHERALNESAVMANTIAGRIKEWEAQAKAA